MIYAPDDFRHGSVARPMGTEMEYYIADCVPNGQSDIQEVLEKLGIKMIGQFTSEGSKIYKDAGGLEYASAVHLGAEQAARADFHGMYLINRLMAKYCKREYLELTRPILRRTGMYARSSSDAASEITFGISSRGYHQNFLTPAIVGKDRDLFKAVMGAFLATRIIWDGAGFAAPGGYRLSQKEDGIGAGVVDGYGARVTHGGKPLAGIIKDDNKLAPGWNLLEVRSADSHMSLDLTERSLAITSLALRLLECGRIEADEADDMTLKNPVVSMHAISKSELGKAKLQLLSGKTTTAAALQEHYAEKMIEMAQDERVHLPDGETAETIEKQILLCQRLAKADMDGLEPLKKDVESIAKLALIRKKYGDDSHRDLTSETRAFDTQWTRTDEKSVGLAVFKMLGDSWPKHTDEYENAPLPETSSAIRARAISNGSCVQADWNYIRLKNQEKVQLSNFWATSLPPKAKTA